MGIKRRFPLASESKAEEELVERVVVNKRRRMLADAARTRSAAESALYYHLRDTLRAHPDATHFYRASDGRVRPA